MCPDGAATPESLHFRVAVDKLHLNLPLENGKECLKEGLFMNGMGPKSDIR